MFVGHALLAFAIAALAARRLGVADERAIQLGALAGLFAAVPDVDVVYAPVGLVLQSAQSLGPDVFWETANVVHVALTGIATAVSGPVGGVVTLVFALGGLAIAMLAAQWHIDPRAAFAVAFVGILSHPFGDLFTGSPPPFLYPFDAVLVAERIALHPDPTTHLLAAFAVELGTIWLAVWTYAHLRGYTLTDLVHPKASLGVGYAAAALLLPAPTLEHSAHFVFSVLALSVVGAPARPFSSGIDWLETVVTGLAAVTVAGLAYAFAYGLI